MDSVRLSCFLKNRTSLQVDVEAHLDENGFFQYQVAGRCAALLISEDLKHDPFRWLVTEEYLNWHEIFIVLL